MSDNYTLHYNPAQLPRELARHYIVANSEDISAMLDSIGLSKLDDIFESIPEEMRFADVPNLPEELAYDELCEHMYSLSQKNTAWPSFIGDGLLDYRVHDEANTKCLGRSPETKASQSTKTRHVAERVCAFL